MGPAVSLLCPAYRTEHTLVETIESVLAQRDGDWELVVCDNGRSDEIARIVTSYADADERVRLVRQDNRGLAGGVAGAAAVARGRYVAVLCSDDHLGPGYVDRLRTVLDERPDVDVVAPDAVPFDEMTGEAERRTQAQMVGFPRRPHRLTLRDIALGRTPCYGGLVRRAVWDALGGFVTDDRPEDLGFWLRLVREHHVLVIPEVHARIRVHADSISRAPEGRERFEARIESAVRTEVDERGDARDRAAFARGQRRRHYLQAIRRARRAFLSGDVPTARRETRRAFRARPTPRAAALVAGTTLAPGALRRVRPLKAALTRSAARLATARRTTSTVA
jgi:hypothetical protein